ncbi:MAG: type II toxin-antitoxin system HicA family toxin [Euryarchaeota archaeon]|nr:type II toxin-antitoxin system HicA family toxin [Euryarchaeota archaeon]
MTKLPIISGRDAIKAFGRAGWFVERQTGSHVIMMKTDSIITLSIPMHSEIKRGTLRSLIKDAGLTVEEFVSLL